MRLILIVDSVFIDEVWVSLCFFYLGRRRYIIVYERSFRDFLRSMGIEYFFVLLVVFNKRECVFGVIDRYYFC